MSVEARHMRRLQEEGRGTIADQSYVKRLIGKWGKLLEGMKERTPQDRYLMGITAMLFENESRHLKELTEDMRTVNVGPFTKFVFPVLRWVFPNLIANEIVSVQPMTAPVGAVFYLDYVYGTSKGGTTAGNTFPSQFDQTFSSENVNGEILASGDGTNYGGAGGTLGVTLAFNPVRPFNQSLGYSVQIQEINPQTGTVVQTATDNGTGGFTFSPAGGGAGTINYANGSISGFKFTNVPASANAIKAFYTYDGELNTKIPQINLDVKQKPVQAIPRRLKAIWSAEAAEDLRAFHGVDAETELVSAVAQEIALEIDRDILNDLVQASTGTTGTFDRVPPAGIPEIDHLRSMMTVISTVSNQIHTKTLRAPANWIVTSPAVSALISQLTTHADFRPLWVSDGASPYGPGDMPRPLTQYGQFGIYKTGTLMNKWMVYEDPYFTNNLMLVGLKGASFLDAGYVWAPYIPLQVTATFLDPSDFSLRKGLRTRYAKSVLRSEFYGQIRFLNL